MTLLDHVIESLQEDRLRSSSMIAKRGYTTKAEVRDYFEAALLRWTKDQPEHQVIGDSCDCFCHEQGNTACSKCGNVH